MLLLLFIIFIIALCFMAGWYVLGSVLIAILFIFFVAAIIGNNKNAEKKRIQQEELKARNAERIKQKEIDKQEYEKKKSELIDKYGQIDKEISISECNANDVIWAFSKASRLWLIGHDLPMSSILSCNLSDASKTIKGKSTIQTKTNTGNMAKRAVVGGVLLGGAGALAGGVTAKKDGTIIQENDKVIHDYTVLVNIDSLSTPIVRLQCGTNGTLANEIIGLLNVIINRNNKV